MDHPRDDEGAAGRPEASGSRPSDGCPQAKPREDPAAAATPTSSRSIDGHRPPSNGPVHHRHHAARVDETPPGEIYGALDLGTNNCRLLLARPSRRGIRVVDAFSRIIRLGEGVSQTGLLSEPAMDRTIDALRVCAGKLTRNSVRRARMVATEACRVAGNGQAFLDRVSRQVGLELEIISREDEAHLAVSGCATLIDSRVDYVLVFDIGGGSSELIWLDLARKRPNGSWHGLEPADVRACMAAWISLPVGVVTLAERYGGRHVSADNFESMVGHVTRLIEPFEAEHGFSRRISAAPAHLLGTSGTVTTVAGIQLGLERYDRTRVDGCWLSVADAREVTYDLLARGYEARVAEPCIGHDRADLVLAGCAILEALIRMWPCPRLRVADRGLREGILASLMTEDGVYRTGRRRPMGRFGHRRG